jgi:ankyrin repeat protein
MKHLFKNEVSDARLGPTKRVVCGFFFNGRGGPMEKTLKGMLRTILHQMVLQNPTAYRGLSRFHRDMKQECASRGKSVVDWTGESLAKMLEVVMQSPTLPVLMFIDALDEGDGFSPTEVFALLETLTGPNSDGYRSAVSVCLSSRPDNFVNHRKKWVTVDLADFNGKDIETYTTNRLYTIAKDCADFRYQQLVTELVPQILRRADGVFLWVRLVVDEISVAMECGETPQYIRAQLSATPNDLWDHFGKMLLKVGNHHLSDMQRLLRILLAAERPLTVEELAHVLPLSAPDPPRTLQEVWDLRSAEQICHDMRKRIQLCSGGLVEVVETNRYFEVYYRCKLAYALTSQVQFIHQSVKDYLNGNQIQEDLGDILGPPGLEGNGHHLLLTACIRCLQLPEVEIAQAASVNLQRHIAGHGNAKREFWAQSQTLWAKTTNQCPLLLYCPHWIRHAERSIAAGDHEESRESWQTMERVFQAWRFFPYNEQLEDGQGRKWSECLYTCIYENMRGTSHEAYSCLLSFSAYQGFVCVFQGVFNAFRQDMSSSDLSYALTAACDCGLAGRSKRIGGVGGRYCRDLEGEMRGFGLPETAWEAKEAIVRLLLNGGADVNQTGQVGDFGSALTAACWGGRLSIVKMLLDDGANVNTEVRGTRYATPLIASVWGSSTAVAKLLIQRGADINAQVRAGYVGSALTEAAIAGDPDMVRALIDGGADVNLVLWYGGFGSALAAAAREGRVAVVQLLIERGASVNMHLPGKFGSALAAAALTRVDGETTMGLLIKAGANIDLPLWSGNYGSALAAAASSSSKAAVELLLRHGANVNLPLRRGEFGTALIAAVRSQYWINDWDNDTWAYHVLVDHGAEINARPRVGRYGSALVAAAAAFDLGLVQDLVTHGADVNAVLDVGIFGSALAAAASCEQFEFNKAAAVALFLLEHGANINAVLLVGRHSSALAAASCDEMEHLLLAHGAALAGIEVSARGYRAR